MAAFRARQDGQPDHAALSAGGHAMRASVEPCSFWVCDGSVDRHSATGRHRDLVAPGYEELHFEVSRTLRHDEARACQQEVIRLAHVVLLDEGRNRLVVTQTRILHADRRARAPEILDQDPRRDYALLDPRPHTPAQ